MFSTFRILAVPLILSLVFLASGCEQQPATSAAPASTKPTQEATGEMAKAVVAESTTPTEATDGETTAADLTGTTPLNFSIHTIHCEGCVQAIRVALNGIEGVRGCEVSLEKQSAVVHVTDPVVAKEIVEAMQRQGREATLQDSAGDDTDPA